MWRIEPYRWTTSDCASTELLCNARSVLAADFHPGVHHVGPQSAGLTVLSDD